MRSARTLAIILIVHLAVIVLWQVLVDAFHVPKFILPSPLATAGDAGLGEICVALQPRGHRGGNPRRLCARRRRRRHAGGRVLLVAAGEPVAAAAVRHPEHDPESGARPAVHRLVQLRHLRQYPDRLQHLLLPDPADHRARLERGRTGPARSGEIAARLALDPVPQDPAAGRAALRVFRHEGRRHPGGRRRHRRRVHRLASAGSAIS